MYLQVLVFALMREIKIKQAMLKRELLLGRRWARGHSAKQWRGPITGKINNDAVTGRGGGWAPMTRRWFGPVAGEVMLVPVARWQGFGNKCHQHSTKKSRRAAAGQREKQQSVCRGRVTSQMGGGGTKQSVPTPVSTHVSLCDHCFGAQAVVFYHTYNPNAKRKLLPPSVSPLPATPPPSPPPRHSFHVCFPCSVCVYSFCGNSFPFLLLSSFHFHSFQATGWGL